MVGRGGERWEGGGEREKERERWEAGRKNIFHVYAFISLLSGLELNSFYKPKDGWMN